MLRKTLRFLLALFVINFPLTARLPAATVDEHPVMGNPSHATTDPANATNYLLRKVEYVLAYTASNATPTWVSWHLNRHWLGNAHRQDKFIPDPDLPAQWPHVDDGDYDKTGFDRGHMCNSEDRTDTQEL